MGESKPTAASMPQKITWDDSFSVGVPELDSQHQRLADLINLLDDDPASPIQDAQFIENAISRLTVYAFTHFGREEKLMAQCGYPRLDAHVSEHEEFGQTLTRFSRDAAAGMLHRDRLFKFLTDWWTHHILSVDMHYKPFLATEKEKPIDSSMGSL